MNFLYPELRVNGALSASTIKLEEDISTDESEFSWLLSVMIVLRVLDLISVFYLRRATDEKQRIKLIEPSLMLNDNELQDFNEKFLDGHETEEEFI